jgi:hypothetical protein
MKAFSVAFFIFASDSWAVKPGDKLYVRIKEASIYETSDVRTKVVQRVKAGTAVVWQGADATTPLMHKVEFTNESKVAIAGFTHQGNLATKPPSGEVVTDDGKTIDAEAFRTSGAATKAVNDTSLAWAEKKNLKDLAKEFESVSELNKRISNSAAQDAARKLGLAAQETTGVVVPGKGKKGKSK